MSQEPAKQVEPKVRHCGAQVCGMHPEHPYTRNGSPMHCPGNGS